MGRPPFPPSAQRRNGKRRPNGAQGATLTNSPAATVSARAQFRGCSVCIVVQWWRTPNKVCVQNGWIRMRLWRVHVGLIAAALFLKALPAPAQITAPTINLIERVLMVELQIKGANCTVSGTIFSFDLDRREYWLTAKHVLTGAKKPPYGSVTEHSVTLAILNPDVQERRWMPVNFTVLDPGEDIDIVVLAAPRPLMAMAGTVMPFSIFGVLHVGG